MRREHVALCRLLGAGAPPPAPIDAVAAQPPLDWAALIETADQHGVTEQLLPPISSMPSHVPPEIVRLLQDRVVQAAAINLRYTRQLAELLEYLHANGISALALKGPGMAAALYGHLGLRSCADLDILVDRRGALRVRPLLMAQGYTLPPRRRNRGGALLHGLYPGAGRDDTLFAPRHEMASVDVHVAFAFWTQGVRLDTRALFARSVSVDVAGVRIATLCPEDLLLVLSIHGMMHGWGFLRHICDIDTVAGHVNDWSAVVARARSARMRRVLDIALLLAHDVLGSRIPSHVFARAADDEHAVNIARSVPPRLFDPPAVWDPRPWFLAFQDDARGRLRFQARTLVYEWFLKWSWDEWLGRRRLPRESL